MLQNHSGETTARRPALGHSEGDFWDQVFDGASMAKVCLFVCLFVGVFDTMLFLSCPQGVFDFNPTRRVTGGYKRRADFNRKELRLFNKKMAAQEKLFVQDTFRT